MKTNLPRFFIVLTIIVVLAGKAGAATLTLTPSAISNTYTGSITLNIAGLTNSQPVTVQTYLDLNGNGVVDAGEPLLDAFNITEGGASVIGGITNISVPFDSNAATGAITTSLSFALPLENIVGQKIYRVVSNPEGAFPPVTAPFDVTNTPLAQSVSGIVYSNGIAPLPYALVVALTLTNQNYVSATLADGAGHYFLTLNPGAYVLLPALPGYFADQNLLPQVTLTNGASATNNLSVTNGPVTISGKVYDAANSNALGGVFLQLQSGSLFEVAFTDTNGNYTAEGTSNNWKIKITSERLAHRGYLTPQNNALQVNATLGSVTNQNIALHKGNALFYGQLTLGNTPVPNIPVECNDNSQILHGKGYTDANGNYAVAALVDANVLGTNNPWFCSVNTGNEINSVLANYIFNQANIIPLTNGEAFLQNFSGLPVTAAISGRLVNSSGTPLSGIGVGASATINGGQYGTTFVDTDVNGYFSFGATSGQWYVNANCCGNNGLDSQGYYDPNNSLHVVNIPPTNAVINLTVYPVGTPLLSQIERISPTQFGFNLNGSSGNNYTVQASTNLVSTNWFNLTIISNFPGNALFIQDNSATNAQRFYRALLGP